MRRKIRRKRGPVVSKKITYDGITFASGLEKYMHVALKKARIQAVYEGHTYEIFPGFDYESSAYERCANGKGEYKDRGNKKILNISYTPVKVEQTKVSLYVGRCLKSTCKNIYLM